MDGYNNVSLVRPDRIHGGVSLFISTWISYRIRNEISIVNKAIECLFIEIELKILETLKPQNQSCYLMGDYNIDLLKHSTHNPTSEFLDLIFSNSFIPLINKPTRITHQTAIIMDNIFIIRTLHDCPSQMNENLLISNSKLTSDSELIWWRQSKNLSSFVRDSHVGCVLYNGKDNHYKKRSWIQISRNVTVLSNHERALLAHPCTFGEKIARFGISWF